MRYATYILIAVLLSSCASNVVYFDIKKNKLWANSKRISSFTIESDSLHESFSVYWSGVYNKAPYSITFDDPHGSYSIEKNRKLLLNNKDFKLNPLSKYTISRHGGDAAPFYLNIWTDSIGRVIRQDGEKP